MRQTILSLCVALLVHVSAFAADRKPNVVVILADDLGYSDLGVQGSGYYRTPNVDALFARGMRFTDAYTNGANCQPTRASLITGMYTPRHGVLSVGGDGWRGRRQTRRLTPVRSRPRLDPSFTTIAEVFKQAGYATGFFGKWHLGEGVQRGPAARGFDVVLQESETVGYGKSTASDEITDHATAFIRERKDKPFFVYLAFFDVHTPLAATPERVAKYQDTPPWRGQGNPTYAGMVDAVDENVGRVVATLDELALSGQTIVVFTSDNGGVGGYDRGNITDNAPLRAGKGTLYEGGVRVPFAIVWPGHVQPGSTCSTPMMLMDLLPTFAQVIGQSLPEEQQIDGRSILPLLSQQPGFEPRPLFWYLPVYLQGVHGSSVDRNRPSASVREGDLKLIWRFEGDELELYDLASDLGEKTNLAERRPQDARRLQQVLKTWMDSVGAEVPQPNPAWNADAQ